MGSSRGLGVLSGAEGPDAVQRLCKRLLDLDGTTRYLHLLVFDLQPQQLELQARAAQTLGHDIVKKTLRAYALRAQYLQDRQCCKFQFSNSRHSNAAGERKSRRIGYHSVSRVDGNVKDDISVLRRWARRIVRRMSRENSVEPRHPAPTVSIESGHMP